jgi:elongation factor P
MFYSATNIRVGHIIEYNNDLYKVLAATHITPGKGNAVMQIKMRNLKTGNQTEVRFRSVEQVKAIDLDYVKMEYLYDDGDMVHFMNQETYDQSAFPRQDVEDVLKFVLPNTIVQMQIYEGDIVGVLLPKSVELTVTECAPYAKGATLVNQTKTVVVETGLQLQAPGFIEAGDKIRVDTETGSYIERVR